jgi:hypothetical protein
MVGAVVLIVGGVVLLAELGWLGVRVLALRSKARVLRSRILPEMAAIKIELVRYQALSAERTVLIARLEPARRLLTNPLLGAVVTSRFK